MMEDQSVQLAKPSTKARLMAVAAGLAVGAILVLALLGVMGIASPLAHPAIPHF